MLKNCYGEPFKVEIPYNFDPQLIEELKKPRYKKYVDMVYTAPYIEDHNGAKKDYIVYSTNHDVTRGQPSTWEEYVVHINNIVASGLDCCLLVQDIIKPMPLHILQKYIDLGIKTFTVNRWDTAVQIRKMCPDARIVGSITRKISAAEYGQGINVDAFDEHVLYFPFNRSLSTLKKLNNKQKYVMLVNCVCSWKCPGHYHWYENVADSHKWVFCKSADLSLRIDILNEDLKQMAPYIYKLKLQGREFVTKDIIEYLNYFIFELNERISFGDRLEYATGQNAYLDKQIVFDKYTNFEILDGWAEWNYDPEKKYPD